MKNILYVIIALAITGGAYFVYQYSQKPPAPAVFDETLVTRYTLEDISIHNYKEDCWFAIQDVVYDVTPFITSGNHPGRDAILEGCGKDATVLYTTRPMGSKTEHSSKAYDMLDGYKIGTLVQ